MDPFIRLKTDGIVIAPETRLLKAADYQAFVQTRDLLAEAKEQAARTQITTFRTALDAYEVDNGGYPRGRNGLQDLIVQPRDSQNWRGPYLQSDRIPTDPWGGEYIYECPGKHNPASYDLSSAGPPGANTPIANWTVDKR